jgi:hypothetical protein
MNPDPFIDPSACRTDPEMAIPYLAHHLRQGSLALALGAGISRYLNLPVWFELVNHCSKDTKFTKETPVRDLTDRMEEIEGEHSEGGKPNKGRSPEYRALVLQALYKDVEYDKALKSDLLLGLGALLIGSRRGSVTEVINFNFDDVLEWYLYLHGYDINVVSTLPALRTAADVTIYHPHGFLPFHEEFQKSDFLIFSQESYDAKMGNLLEPWTDLTRMILKSKIVLFVGLSGTDETFGPIFKNVQDSLGNSRRTGVWLFTKKDEPRKLDKLETRNFITLVLKDHEEWPNFLLKICQAAAKAC